MKKRQQNKHKKNAFYAALGTMALLLCLPVLLLALDHNKQPKDMRSYAAANTSVPFNSITYHVSGKQILDNNNSSLIPYGMQLDGILMAQPSWQTDDALTYLTFDQVKEAHDFWHSNTVSLQLGSKALFAKAPYDTDYLAAVDQTVSWANQLGMNILLVLQYQGDGNSGQQMPTQDSIAFWNIVAKHYANNPHIFFDVFNEPDPWTLLGGNPSANSYWSLWQKGGIVQGKTYLGMQQIVDSIRNKGITNLLFVDGPATGEDISSVSQYPISGSNIIYAIHPYLSPTQHHTQSGSGQQRNDEIGAKPSGNSIDSQSYHSQGTHYPSGTQTRMIR